MRSDIFMAESSCLSFGSKGDTDSSGPRGASIAILRARDARARDAASGAVSQDHSSGLRRLGADELERPPLDSGEERLAAAEQNRMHDQAQLVEQICAEQAPHERRSADDVDVPSRAALELAQLGEVADDPRLRPG